MFGLNNLCGQSDESITQKFIVTGWFFRFSGGLIVQEQRIKGSQVLLALQVVQRAMIQSVCLICINIQCFICTAGALVVVTVWGVWSIPSHPTKLQYKATKAHCKRIQYSICYIWTPYDLSSQNWIVRSCVVPFPSRQQFEAKKMNKNRVSRNIC